MTGIETPTVSEILREEFMEPMGLSAYRLAQSIHVPVSRIQAILHDSLCALILTMISSRAEAKNNWIILDKMLRKIYNVRVKLSLRRDVLINFWN